MKDIPKPSTDFLSTIDGIKNKLDFCMRDTFNFWSILFRNTTWFSNLSSLTSECNRFFSSPSPIIIYLIFG